MIARTALATSALLTVVLSPDATAQRGGRSRQDAKLVERFDEDGNGRLERSERDAARKHLAENPAPRRRRGRGRGGDADPRAPGPAVSPDDVESYPDRPLYDTGVLRTLFIEFEHDDWEAELAAFYRSDVEVPAKLTVDGQQLDQVGMRFRGNTSYGSVPPGRKKSFNVSIDFVHEDQRLYGYKTLNLLNGHADPSFLNEVLHAHIGRQFAPFPQAALVHVVINGESWGVFTNQQQLNKEYLEEAFGTRKGARWRVPPNFGGDGGMRFLGDEVDGYSSAYEAKSGVDDDARRRLVEVCRVLNQTTVDERREQLPSLLDIDGTLWFLAIDNVLVDGDGYLTRASDHALYLDPTGVFHLITYDNNEILRGARGGPGPRGGGQRGQRGGRRGGGQRGGQLGGGRGRGRGGPGRGPRISPDQSPLAGADIEARPLLHKLLEVPEWRARYLAHVHSMVTRALDWQVLGPEVQRLHDMIADITHADTRKLYGNDQFDASVARIRDVAGQRYDAILSHESMKGPWPTIESVDANVDGDTLRVTAHVGEVEVADAWLHWQLRRPGPFAAIEMTRAEDGSFHAEIPPQKPGEKIHYYVEVRSADESGRVAFETAGASSLATPYRFAK